MCADSAPSEPWQSTKTVIGEKRKRTVRHMLAFLPLPPRHRLSIETYDSSMGLVTTRLGEPMQSVDSSIPLIICLHSRHVQPRQPIHVCAYWCQLLLGLIGVLWRLVLIIPNRAFSDVLVAYFKNLLSTYQFQTSEASAWHPPTGRKSSIAGPALWLRNMVVEERCARTFCLSPLSS